MSEVGEFAEIGALCEVMHDAYEKAAADSGWATQERSRVPWTDVPEANKRAMRAAVRALLDHLSEREINDDVVRSASAPVSLLGGLSGDAESVADDLPGQAAVAQHLGLTPDGVVDGLGEGAQVGERLGSDVRVVVAPGEVDDGSLGVAAPVSGEGHASTVVDKVSFCQRELTSAVPTNSSGPVNAEKDARRERPGYNAGGSIDSHAAKIAQVIEECQRKRPTGPGGKHDDLHTPECGCRR